MTTGDSENLEKSRKNENPKFYESSDFNQNLESQNEIRNLDLTPKGGETLPPLGFRCKYKHYLSI